ncbi:MAG TPA: UbiA family prenyltransferase [Cyclobacteriaceae bacterium]|nr:UbiA family prenyltransferase [Cyclobacteriaceae bacterium]
MLSWSTILHLRIPFSFFLMPVFLFALCISPNIDGDSILWSFVIIHLLLYPASNGYNSYFDKDEKSIGGLKNPPPVKKDLYYVSVFFDVAAIVLGLLMVSKEFAVMLFIYGLASKAYSHPSVRLKKYPIAGWLTVVFFQGIFAFAMCYAGINKFGFENLLQSKVLVPGFLCSLMLFATYPMTQVYQHEEDVQRGDITMSVRLGIRGTFYFAMTFFAIAATGFIYYFGTAFTAFYTVVFIITQSPVVLYFFFWFAAVIQDRSNADHKSTMRLNLISSLCMNAFFVFLFLHAGHLI